MNFQESSGGTCAIANEKLTQYNHRQQGGLIGGAGIAPREPGLIDCAGEALKYLDDIDSSLGALRERLYGPQPECSDKVPYLGNSLQDSLRLIAQRSAQAAGELKSILGRL